MPTLAGFVLLVWGADRFVVGAAATARNLGVPPLLIGLTMVGFATSAPEILVSVMASLAGDPDLAVGNAIGSNIANIAPGARHHRPDHAHRRAFHHPAPRDAGAAGGDPGPDHDASSTCASVASRASLLLGTLVLVLYWLVVLGTRSDAADPISLDYAAEIPEGLPMRKAIGWLVVGLVVLLTGANLLVWGAQQLAIAFGRLAT